MSKKARKRKIGTIVYWGFIFIWVVLLICAAVYGLKLVWTYAEEYEAARPNPVIDAYVDKFNEELWVDGIDEAIASMPHEVQTDEECAVCVKELLNGGISYVRQGSKDGGKTISYKLKCNSNGNTIGSVSMAEDTDKADELRFKNLLPWKIVDEQFDFTGLYTSVEIVVPRMYTVKLNGVELDSEKIVETGIPYDVLEPYYNVFPDLPTKVKYKFDNCIGLLEPVVYDQDGNEVVIDETKDDSQYIVQCSEEMLGRLSDFSAAFADRYLKYIAGVTNPLNAYADLKKYIVLDTDFDRRLKEMMDGLSYGHTASYRMDSARLNGALDMGDGYYICDLTADYTTFYPGRGEEVGTSNMRVICVDDGSSIKAISQELY